MDTSDFYPIAIKALNALQHSKPRISRSDELIYHCDAINDLKKFIDSADLERAENNTSDNYRAHIREG